MASATWVYCRECKWQNDEPQFHDTETPKVPSTPVCPACKANGLGCAMFNRYAWMKYGAELISGDKIVAIVIQEASNNNG